MHVIMSTHYGEAQVILMASVLIKQVMKLGGNCMSGDARGSLCRRSRETSLVQTEIGVNGDLLWHTGPNVWGQCGHRPVRSQAEMAPHWTGVNYGAKGFAKTICHDESSGRQRTQLLFFSFYFLEMHDFLQREKKLLSSLPNTTSFSLSFSSLKTVLNPLLCIKPLDRCNSMCALHLAVDIQQVNFFVLYLLNQL